jgi:hypothetical protein
VLGLIVLTPNGANLGVVATNDLYEGYESYGGHPGHDTVTVRKLGPNGTYGWLARLRYQHSGDVDEWVQVYGVIGNSVKLLTAITTYLSDEGRNGCGPEAHCTVLSAKYVFDTHSSATFYPLILQVSGIQKCRPFRGNYRLVFDKSLLTYLAPNNMPDEFKPSPFIALPEPGTHSHAVSRASEETVRPRTYSLWAWSYEDKSWILEESRISKEDCEQDIAHGPRGETMNKLAEDMANDPHRDDHLSFCAPTGASWTTGKTIVVRCAGFFESEPGRRAAANLMTKEGKRVAMERVAMEKAAIAANLPKLLEVGVKY